MRIRRVVVAVCVFLFVLGMVVAAWLNPQATLAGKIASEAAIAGVVGLTVWIYE